MKTRCAPLILGVGLALLALIGITAGKFSGDLNAGAAPGPKGVAPVTHNALNQSKVLETYGNLSLSFEANQGQTEDEVKFLSHGSGYSLFLTSTEAVLVLSKSRGKQALSHLPAAKPEGTEMTKTAVLRMKLTGANPAARVIGLEELPGKINYFAGNNQTKWRTNIPTYAKVKYQDVYPGVDVVYYGTQRQLEHDFVLAPGADPKTITLGFEGADKLELSTNGDLVIHTAGGPVRQSKPVVYQERDGVRREISGGYVLKDKQHIGFHLAAYDTARPLVIDPVVYSTYLGGSGNDFAMGVTVDAAGYAYVTGWTDSVDFSTMSGAFQTVLRGPKDAFVLKINPEGTAFVYSTFLGGSGYESEVVAIAVDAAGNAYVTGFTASQDFPTTPGAVQTSNRGVFDIFVTKLNPTGSALAYSTYLGGSDIDGSQSIAVDTAGNTYVTGLTKSVNFPITTGAFQTASGGGDDTFVTKLNPTGSALAYSSYLGGSNNEFAPGIALDAAGNAYVTGLTKSVNFPTTTGAFQTASGGGDDAFVTKLNPTGSGLVYSTYLGGSGNDDSRDIAVDAAGNAYVTGFTGSQDFPTTTGAFQVTYAGADVFVTKLNPTGSALVYSSYLGGSELDFSKRIAVDATGNAHVTGSTFSGNFPATPNAIQTAYGGGEDAFVAKVNSNGSVLLFTTFLGGSGDDRGRGIAVDAAGNVYVTGFTSSTNFPTTNPIQATFGGSGSDLCFATSGCDGFIAKIAIVGQPKLSGRIVAKGVVSPGVLFVGLQLTNTGTGNALTITLSQIIFRTLAGSGTVTYSSPPLPLALGNLDVGASTTIRLFLNVPATVTKFSITENGSVQDVVGTNFSFSIGQAVIP